MVEPRFTEPPKDTRALTDDYDRLVALAGEQRFERTFTTGIVTLDEGWLSLTALDDDFHSMRVALRVQPDGTIAEAAGKMLRHPFDTCPRAIEALRGLVGVSVFGSGASARIAQRVPRDEGCLHVADMLAVAFRSFKIARGHDMPWPAGEERRRQIITLLPSVRNTCVSFAVVGEGDARV